MGFVHGQRAMQAGLKCDRVPQNAPADMCRIPYSTCRAEKSPFCNKMAERTMQPTTDFDASKLARSLLRRSGRGAGHLMPESGDPYCSLVTSPAMWTPPDLLISRLACIRKYSRRQPVSLMLDERAAGDPLEGARIMWRAGRRRPQGRRRKSCAGATSTPIHLRWASWISRIFRSFGSRRQACIWSPVLAASSTSSQSSF